MTDFKDSYKQKCWEFIVATHARMKQRLIDYPDNKGIQEWAKERIEDLEKHHPQLRK